VILLVQAFSNTSLNAGDSRIDSMVCLLEIVEGLVGRLRVRQLEESFSPLQLVTLVNALGKLMQGSVAQENEIIKKEI
jgi:hypothetical protein